MEIFTVKEGKLEVIPENLNIPEFLAIWERDKTPAKLTAKSELLYIYHMNSYHSIYRDYPIDKKETYIINDFVGKKDWKPDELIQSAMTRYKEHQYNSSFALQFLDSQMHSLRKVMDYNYNVNFTERDVKGQPVYKLGEITKAATEAGKILQALEALKEKVEKEMSLNTSKIRGKGKVNSREI